MHFERSRPSGFHRSVLLTVMTLCLALQTRAVSAQVTWRGDFESDNFSQWDYLLNEAGLSVVSEPVLLGARAAQVRIGPMDLWSNGLNRVEFQHKPPSELTAEDSEIFFGWSLYLPEALTSDDHQLGYWETEESYQQVMSLHARGQDLSFNTNLGGYRQHWQGSGVLTPGTWHRVVFHIKWSSDSAAGEVSLWFDGVKVVDAVKVRTYGGNRAFIQLGILRDTIETVETLFIDEALEGTQLEDVALTATLPAAPSAEPAATTEPSSPSGTPPNTPTPNSPEASPPAPASPTPSSPPTPTAPATAEGGSQSGDSKSSGCALGAAAKRNDAGRGATLWLLLLGGLGACRLSARRRQPAQQR